MNILFLLKSLETGGLEVVTSVLANKFITEGHKVYVYSFLDGKNSVARRFDKRVELEVMNDYSVSKHNVEALHRILVENKIDVIINQWGLPLIPIKTARKASKGLDVKIISVYHNAPSFNGRIQKMNIAVTCYENPLKRLVFRTIKSAYRMVTSRAMAYIYKKSDRFLVLSDCYIKEFKKFTGIRNIGKLGVMTNPVTIENTDYEYSLEKKLKEIIYVGRLDFVQKRVYRVIDTWIYLEGKYPKWKLTIIGDGEDKENLENHVKALGLKRVSFEGFKNPINYYKRASVLMLTSDFEGFPLVLAECMSFGVVPVVYHSYAAVEDIIEDRRNGIVQPFCKEGFNAEDMARRISELMKDKDRRNNMAISAIEKSRNYSVDEIYRRWMGMLTSVVYNGQNSKNGKLQIH